MSQEAKPNPPAPTVLLILDGWGYRTETDQNAIALAKTPVWDRLWTERPHTLIRTSGAAVGLPGNQMGNSEVGHLNIGAGRVVYQELTRISRAIRTGSFFSNRTLTDLVDGAIARQRAVHILGLLSPGGVHSHEEHIQAMVRLAAERGMQRLYLHAFLDGRDTPPRSAEASLAAMQHLFDELGTGRFASVVGRYFAMDRDRRWQRVCTAYDVITAGQAGHRAPDALQALAAAYARDESDEFVSPTAIAAEHEDPVRIENGDAVVFMNFRSDRARELTKALIENHFDGFHRAYFPQLGAFVSLTEYSDELDCPVAFPPEPLEDSFGEYIARQGLRQLRLAETEKYAHVTFFFNGGVETAFEGEERILVPSPPVATYDQQPAMSADKVTQHLVDAIIEGRHEVIICNYANPDMVGHSGNLPATIEAIEILDGCLGQVINALQSRGGEMLITADHGNAEQMRDPTTDQPHTAHTSNPVPLVYVGPRNLQFRDNGALCDLAPTLLAMMGLRQPQVMSGESLLLMPEVPE